MRTLVSKEKNAPHTEELTSRSAEGNVRALVVVDGSLRKHGVVLNLRLAQRVSVGRDKDELRPATAHVLHRALKAERNLARLHDELELRVDVLLRGLLALRLGSHRLGQHDNVQFMVGAESVVRFSNSTGNIRPNSNFTVFT